MLNQPSCHRYGAPLPKEITHADSVVPDAGRNKQNPTCFQTHSGTSKNSVFPYKQMQSVHRSAGAIWAQIVAV